MRLGVALLAPLALLALGRVARADDADPELLSVTATLRGQTVISTARFLLRFEGAVHQSNTMAIELPETAIATRATARTGSAIHRFELLNADQAQARFDALAGLPERSGRHFGLLIEARPGALSLSIAAPRDGTLTLEVELAMTSCYYRDMRYVRLPAHWRKLVPSALVVRAKQVSEIAGGCGADGANEPTDLWIGLPARELTRRPAGAERFAALAARVALGTTHLTRLDLAIANHLGEIPGDLATAILVDTSRSMSSNQLAAQREIVRAYARAAAASPIQVIAYARTARALLPSWTPARLATARVDRELAALAARNGSNLDAGVIEAGRWLSRITGTRRVVLVTDELFPSRLDAKLAQLAQHLPPGTLVHVIAVDDASVLERDDAVLGADLAVATGGIGVRAGVLTQGVHDVTMLLRPITLDRVAIKPSGWTQIATTHALTCADQLAEGHGCTWFGDGGVLAGPIAVEGYVWSKKIERIVTPNPSRAVELARDLDGASFLDEEGLERVAVLARGVNRAWSLYAEWGPGGGYADGVGAIHSSSCCDSTMLSHTRGVGSSGVGVRVGHVVPPFELEPQLAGAVSRCNLGTVAVTADIETTLSEIVDVRVVGPAEVARCVEEAIWETAVTVPREFPTHTSHVTFRAAG